MRLRFALSPSLLSAGVLLLFVAPCAFAQHDALMTSAEDRAAMHATEEWKTVFPHLPDPQTATPAALETAGDVLHARRFVDDALDYYGYAIARGGDVSLLLNKMGILRLELRQYELAKVMFQRTTRARKSNAQGWNNLGVAEYSMQNYRQAIADYKRASKLDPKSAVYHSNMGMAYFETKDMETARKELQAAIQIDPGIMQQRDSGGTMAHVLSSSNYPQLCFEMAKLYARRGETAHMRLWLAKASEGGYDVKEGMSQDAHLQPFLRDAEVRMMLANTAQMRKRTVASVSAPSLGGGGSKRVED